MAAAAQQEGHLIHQLIRHSNSAATIVEYNRTAWDYDVYFTPDFYGAPRCTAEEVLARFPEDGDRLRADVRVLDVAAGTGRVGQILHHAGFRKIDGLEPSDEMVRIAQHLTIYGRLLCDTIGEHHLDVEDNLYDVACMAGGFAPGHVPVSAVHDMIRVCKPGGLVIIGVRMEFLITNKEYRKLEPLIEALEEQRLCQCVDRVIKDNYYEHHEGVVYIIRKL